MPGETLHYKKFLINFVSSIAQTEAIADALTFRPSNLLRAKSSSKADG